MMWRYSIGTVVRFIPTEDYPDALWGHVQEFAQTAQGQTAIAVMWENGDVEIVMPSEVEVQP